jgi:hypothetical protein
MLLVTHAQCAEHGELLHVDGLGGDDARVETPEAVEVSGVGADPAPATGSHEHDHCVVASVRKSQAPIKSATGPATTISDSLPRQTSATDPARPALVAVYVLAPKNSPPV